MSIEMKCDACEMIIPPEINGGVRLKMGKKEYVFHLCAACQNDLREEIKEEFLSGRDWREV